jgi:hypothetical protein
MGHIHTKALTHFGSVARDELSVEHHIARRQLVMKKIDDTRRPTLLVRFVTGTYTLQTNRNKYNQHGVDKCCPLCKAPVEDQEHVLVHCPAYMDKRKEAIASITPALADSNLVLSNRKWTQLFLDPTKQTSEDVIREDGFLSVAFHSIES